MLNQFLKVLNHFKGTEIIRDRILASCYLFQITTYTNHYMIGELNIFFFLKSYALN